MKTPQLFIAGLTLAVNSAAFAGSITIAGDRAQLQQVTLSLSAENKSVAITLPAINQALKVSAADLKTLDFGIAADGRRTVTAVFAGTPSLSTDGNQISISDTSPPPGASATPLVVTAPTTPAKAPAVTKGEKPATTTPKETPPEALVVKNIAVTLPEKPGLKNRSASFDASVPESPAAAVIGSTAKLVRLNDGKDASTQLLNLSDADGKISTGFSFAFHPYRLLAKPTLDRYLFGTGPATDDFRGGKWVRFLSRLDLSLAATVDEPVAGSNTRGVTAALGLSGFVFNKADSRLHFARRLDLKTPDADLRAVDPNLVDTITKNQVTVLPSEATARIANEVYDAIWNDSYWAFGVAPRMRSTSGNISQLSYDGGSAWTTMSYGFEGAKKNFGLGFLEDNSQLLLHTSFRDRQRVTDPTNPTGKITEDAWIAGAQLRLGGNDWNVFGEISWEKHRPKDRPRRSTETYFVGFERKLKEDLWLQLSAGSEETPDGSGRSAVIRTALSYAFGDTLMAPAKGSK
jgi:hypothetical protein